MAIGTDTSDIDETFEEMGRLLSTIQQKGKDATEADMRSALNPTTPTAGNPTAGTPSNPQQDAKAAKFLKVEYPNGPTKPLAVAPTVAPKLVNSPTTNHQLEQAGLQGKPMTFQQPIRGSWQNLGPYTETPFSRPVDGPGAKPRNHLGLDLGAPGGTPIFPVAPGIVGAISYEADPDNANKLGGTSVWVKHYDGKISSYYAHMDNVMVHTGQAVDMSTQLGTVGKTGNARGTSTHLHLGMMIGGKWVDPGAFFGNSPTSQQVVRAGQFFRLISLAEKIEKILR